MGSSPAGADGAATRKPGTGGLLIGPGWFSYPKTRAAVLHPPLTSNSSARNPGKVIPFTFPIPTIPCSESNDLPPTISRHVLSDLRDTFGEVLVNSRRAPTALSKPWPNA
ncbi:hypothetical protein BHM03_00047175 [Ensete ventricosum]|nr:hypothetical protein BHM03_00047175 [Ensete ventricosum]